MSFKHLIIEMILQEPRLESHPDSSNNNISQGLDRKSSSVEVMPSEKPKAVRMEGLLGMSGKIVNKSQEQSLKNEEFDVPNANEKLESITKMRPRPKGCISFLMFFLILFSYVCIYVPLISLKFLRFKNSLSITY